ncbi:MAG: hypothetical protein RL751_470, partial [Bacteroidota bacterium]
MRYLLNYNLGTWKNTVATGMRYFHGDMKRKQVGVGSAGNDMNFAVQGLYLRDLNFQNINYAAFAETILRPTDPLLITLGARLEQIDTHMAGQSGLS